MAEAKKETEAPKTLNDVSKPGDTPAGATSRPIIVKHRAIMQDPMMTSPQSDPEAPDPGVEAEEKVDDTIAKKVTLTPSKEAVENSDEQKDTEDKSQATEDNNQATDKKNVGSAAVDLLANEAVKKKEENKEDTKKIQEIEQHITNKTYYAPTGQITKRKAKIHITLSILAFLLVVVGYLAIDAGVILSEVKLPVDIIK